MKTQHVSLLDPCKGSRNWRMIVRCLPLTLNHSFSKIREGRIYFWYDRWLDDSLLKNFFSSMSFSKDYGARM